MCFHIIKICFLLNFPFLLTKKIDFCCLQLRTCLLHLSSNGSPKLLLLQVPAVMVCPSYLENMQAKEMNKS